MANKDYNFQYTPLTGRLPGNSFVKQTEQAINELAGIVNEGAAQVEVITNLANQANDNSEVALEKATEALETSSRVYITLPNLDDADDYFDSQLYYFANSHSANLPVEDTGFLEVKTNDTKTAAEQVFIADDTGLCYFRHGVITSTEVGDETVYSVTWETWSSALASEDYVQQEVNNGVTTAKNYTDEQISAEETRADGKYLPLAGGTMTGNIEYVGANDRVFTAGGFSSVDKDNVDIGWNYQNGDGALIGLRSADSAASGEFQIIARNGNDYSQLVGKPSGGLTWNGNNVLTNGVVGTRYTASWTATTSSAVGTVLTGTISNLPIGVYLVIGKLPNISTSLFGTTWHYTGSYFALSDIVGLYGSGNTFTNILIVVNATNTLWLGSGQSGACNFTYLDRGGICAVRLA